MARARGPWRRCAVTLARGKELTKPHAAIGLSAVGDRPHVLGSARRPDDRFPPLLRGRTCDHTVADVQAFYTQSRTFESDFDQRFWVKAHNKRLNSQGHVTFAKPGKMDWHDTNGNRVVSDGTLVKVYDAANQQMVEQAVSNSQYPAALSFLVGTGTLSGSFNFTLPAAMTFPGGYVLVGTPKQPTPSYSNVLFYVDSATSQVRRVMVVDGQGNRSSFDFKNPVINQPGQRHGFSSPRLLARRSSTRRPSNDGLCKRRADAACACAAAPS